jgi:hypothetical protein
MTYYDVICEAHSALKIEAKHLGVEGVMTVSYSAPVATTL